MTQMTSCVRGMQKLSLVGQVYADSYASGARQVGKATEKGFQ